MIVTNNWFRPFLKNLSSRIGKITDILKNHETKNIKWLPHYTDIVKEIIIGLENVILIFHPDPNLPYTLVTDASNDGSRALLLQQNNIVGINSSKFSDIQKRYSTPEKEFVAILQGLHWFKNIIYGYKIFVFTDNKNLTYIPNNNRINRWKINLEKFNCELKFIQGKNNQEADFFSLNFLISEMQNIEYSKILEKQLREIKY